MYENVTDKFKEDSMMCAGGEDRDACQVTNNIFDIHLVTETRCRLSNVYIHMNF